NRPRMAPTPPSRSRAPAPEQCIRARACAPHGIAARPALPGVSPDPSVRQAGTRVAHKGPANMRRLTPGLLALYCFAVVAPVYAAKRCGDDVGGRAVPSDCGDVLVGARSLGDEYPIVVRICPGTGLVVSLPAGQSATL